MAYLDAFESATTLAGMSNLIPTPIVDKNGVASTRNKKPVRHSDASGIPSPTLTMKAMSSGVAEGAKDEGVSGGNFFTRWQDRRRQKKADEVAAVERAAAIEVLIGELFLGSGEQFGGTIPELVAQSVERTLSTEEIRMAIDLVQLVTRDGIAAEDARSDRMSMVWTLRSSMQEKHCGVRVRALTAHADWLKSHPGETEKLRKTISNLAGMDMIANGGNDGIEHLNEYMAASMHPAYDSFKIIAIWRKDFMAAAVRHPDRLDDIVAYFRAGNGFKEEGFEEFLSAVAKRPDKVEKMKEYMMARGTFDEDGFEQYVNAAAPLAEGAL